MSNPGQQTAEALRQREAELGSQTEALAHFRQVAASHELRLLQLEHEVNELCQRLGESGRYPLKFEPDTKLTQTELPGDGAMPLAQTVEKLSAELRESEERYRALFESLDEGYCVIEKVGGEAGELLDFRYVEANPAFAAQTGLSGVLGKTLRQVLPDEFEERIRTYDSIHRTGEPVRFQREFVTHGRVLELYAFRVADKAHGRVAINLQDITGRKQAERLLRQNHETFFNLIENAPFGLYVVDAQFRLCQVSTASRKVFSNIDPLIGRDFEEVLRLVWAEPFVSEALGHFRHTLATGEPYSAPNTTEQRQNIPEIESYDWKIERITLPDGQYGVVCYFYDITERMQAEAALRESEERLRLALAVGGMGVWVVDLTPGGRATFDEQMCALIGLDPACRELAMSEILEKVIHPDDRELVQTAMSRIVEGDRVRGVVEYRMIRPDGAVVWLQGDGTTQQDAAGTPVRFIGVNFDITERKQADEALRESEAFSRSIIKSSPDCIKVLDLEGNLISMESGQELLGIEDIQPFLNKSWIDFWEGIDDKRAAQAAVASAAAGGAGSFVGFLRTLHGEAKWWDVAISPILDADGKPARLLAVSRDVTQRQQAEEALRASEERVGLALDAAELGTFNIELPSNTLTADARFRTIFGIASGNVDYEQAFATVHPEDRPRQRDAVAAATRTDAPVPYATEYRVVHPDGAIRWVFAKGRANFGAGEVTARKLLSFDGTVADITERKQAEEVLRQSTAQFETLLNEAPLGVYLIDADFRIRQVNPTALPVFGNIPELIGRDFAGVMHILWPKAQADGVIQKFRHTLETGEACFVPELIEKRADRQAIEYYEWQISRIPLPDGHHGVVCYFRDISERVLAQQKIRESEERYRGLFNSIDEGFAILEIIFDEEKQAVDYRFLDVNPAFEKQTGIADATGQRMRELSPDQQAEGIEIYAKVLQTGEPVRFVKASKALGRYFDVYATRLGAPESRKIAVVFNNITERKEADEALRESESRFRALVLASSDLMCRMSPDWSEMRQVYDKNFVVETEVSNANWLEYYVYRDDQPRLMAAVQEAIRTKSLFEMEHRVRRVDGSWGWMLSRAVPLLNAQGEIIEWFGTGSDVTVQKQAEQALRESEERYRSLFNSMDEGYCIIEMIFDEDHKPVDWRYLEVNPSFVTLTGIHDIVGKRIRELVPDNEQYWFDIYGKVALTGEAIRFVNEAKGLDGRWFDLYAFRLGGPESSSVAVLFNNITERIRRERNLGFLVELQHTLAGLDSCARLLHVASKRIAEYLQLRHCLLSEINQGTGQATVLHEYLAEGAPALERVRPLTELRTEAQRQELAAGQTLVSADVLLEQRGAVELQRLAARGVRSQVSAPYVVDGQWKFLLTALRGQPYDWPQDEVELITELAARVYVHVERARAQERLVESEERLRLAAEAAHFGTYDRDLGGAYFHVSGQIKQMLGYEPDAPLGHLQVMSHFHPDDQAAGLAALERACDPAGDGQIAVEQRIVRRDGTVRWISSVGRVLFEDGAPKRSIGFWVDITERKHLERETLAQAQTLAELDRRKDEFLAMLAHELRNPLAALANAAQLLRLQKHEDLLQQQSRSIIERQVGQLKHLVDDLLDVSRISSGNVRLRLAPVSVSGVVERALETAGPLIAQGRHELEVALPSQAIFVHGDAARIEQVLVNLLTNAAKYTEDGGRIWLSVEQDLDTPVPMAEIKVRDNGIGIARELMPHIFDLFTQAERSLDRAQGGLGLGLSLVQRLVELHGGTVTASSVPGQGSEFIVRLPLLQSTLTPLPALDSAAPPDQPALPVASGCRVLVVDDNVDAAQSLGVLLELTGHAVCLAYDGPSALQAAINFRPDVALLDIGLPGLDGFEVAQRIRHQAALKGMVLVALTGYGQDTDRQRSQDAGFDHHLVKPASFDEIEKILLRVSERVT